MLASLKAFLMGGGSLTPSRALSAVVPLQIRAQCQVPAVPVPAQVTVGGRTILFPLKLNHASPAAAVQGCGRFEPFAFLDPLLELARLLCSC